MIRLAHQAVAILRALPKLPDFCRHLAELELRLGQAELDIDDIDTRPRQRRGRRARAPRRPGRADPEGDPWLTSLHAKAAARDGCSPTLSESA